MAKWLLSAALIAWAAAPALAQGPCLGQGELVGEVTPTTAIIRIRLTLNETPNPGLVPTVTPRPPAAGKKAATASAAASAAAVTAPAATASAPASMPASPMAWLEDMPGAPGWVRTVYGTAADLAGAKATAWRGVDAKTDFSAQFELTGLSPAKTYYYRAECAPPSGGKEPQAAARQGPIGSFVTAPAADQAAAVRFCVITGQAMRSRDLVRPDGRHDFNSYAAMAALAPAFLVSTGDSVYYDNDGWLAVDEPTALYHWRRIYALPNVQAFFRHAGGYWEKDDHDYRWNDCWPAQAAPNRLGMNITDELGRRLFRQSVPMGEKTYRTFVWGKGVQIWLPEGRDFRSPNDSPDGLEKSIWGAEQKEWLKKTLAASTCRYKILISPTPIIGPDREAKGDNHASTRQTGFNHEGREFLQWAAQQKLQGFYIVCGDRHWQYHSMDPATKVQEFSCGPISDLHAQKGPGEIPEYHKYYQEKGGFLEVLAEPKDGAWQIAFRHHRPDGAVAYEAVNP